MQTVSQGLAAGLLAGGSSAVAAPAGSEYSAAGRTKLSMPGLHPGRVCAIANPAVLASGQYQAAQVQAMMRRGMVELTGAGDWQKVSTFVHRQPEHVEIAGALGLGVWDRNKIDLRKVPLPPA
jgi:hypothetical protein